MFNGETYAAYVVRTAPAKAQQIVHAWSPDQLRATSVDEVAASIVDQLEIAPIHYIPDASGWVWNNPALPTEGGEVRIKLATSDGGDAAAFFNFAPSSQMGSPGRVYFSSPNYVVVDNVSPADAARALQAVESNIDSLNRDIERGRDSLRTHILNVVQGRIRELERDDEASAKSRQSLRESGIRVLNESSSPVNIEAVAGVGVVGSAPSVEIETPDRPSDDSAAANRANSGPVEPSDEEVATWGPREQSLLSDTTAAILRGSPRALLPQVRDVRVRMERIVDSPTEPEDLRRLAQIAAWALGQIQQRLDASEVTISPAEQELRIRLLSFLEGGCEMAILMSSTAGKPAPTAAFWITGKIVRFLRGRWQ